MTISADNFHYNKETKTFSCEISDIHDIHMSGLIPRSISIVNKKTGVSKTFSFSHTDMDGSQEDVYGYNYKNEELGLKLLLIND